ncbi:hypothetical protein M9458_053099, partial [Cirrhinus mrigala]
MAGPVHPGHNFPRFLPQCRDTTNPGVAAEDTSQRLRSPLLDGTQSSETPLSVAKGKVHTHCFPGAHILSLSAMFLIPAILIDDEGIRVAMFHMGVNDIKLWQTVILKRDFRSLIETVHSTSPTMRIGSGSLPL